MSRMVTVGRRICGIFTVERGDVTYARMVFRGKAGEMSNRRVVVEWFGSYSDTASALVTVQVRDNVLDDWTTATRQCVELKQVSLVGPGPWGLRNVKTLPVIDVNLLYKSDFLHDPE